MIEPNEKPTKSRLGYSEQHARARGLVAKASLCRVVNHLFSIGMLWISFRQANQDLNADVMLDGGERAAAHIEWQWATMIKRTHALVESLRVAMDFDEAQFDALWIYGAAL